ncbi:E3 SUMO-protein ligase nse2 [Colletotrichum spinosum]|uniref:E3 SUMO-protein ligase nse2 n=1 Tax=Colletotrichum spinosum TaxID=1347390 RepID=A0A4R8Q985_9PEZI|nr:E3 SUMO-protein ligase nse2 [Colletotrichum spinosum]
MPVLERRRPTQRRERRASPTSSAGALPDYEPLACPLTDEAKRAIAELSNARDTHRYQKHIKSSIQHLGKAVAEINDAARDRHEWIARMAAKRAETGIEAKTQREEDVEAHTEMLEAEVPRLTAEAEAAMRDLIDRQVQLEDDKVALAETVDYFQRLPPPPSRQQQRRRRVAEDEDGQEQEAEDDDAPPPPEKSVIDALREQRADKTLAYQNMTPHQRYAVQNDYAHFKKLLHDAANGDSGAPLPNARRWFDNDGNPVMPRLSSFKDIKADGRRGNAAGGGNDDEDEDEDLVIAGEVRDYRCPLSLQELKEPYSNNVCSHTYEKQWIVDMLRKSANRRAQCVVAGCDKEFSLDDFFFDQVILRKMERAKQQQRLAEEEGSSSAEEGNNDDDDELREVKRKGRRTGNVKRKVEEIDD